MSDKNIIRETIKTALSEHSLNLMRLHKSGGIDETAVIAREDFLPQFTVRNWASELVGVVVTSDGQVWKLLQPYDGTVYPGTPDTLRAQWSLLHTKDPAKAKPYVAPQGTSGVYSTDECVLADGAVYKSKIDNNVWEPKDYPQGWEAVTI
jgi:hypothetical protein